MDLLTSHLLESFETAATLRLRTAEVRRDSFQRTSSSIGVIRCCFAAVVVLHAFSGFRCCCAGLLHRGSAVSILAVVHPDDPPARCDVETHTWDAVTVS